MLLGSQICHGALRRKSKISTPPFLLQVSETKVSAVVSHLSSSGAQENVAAREDLYKA